MEKRVGVLGGGQLGAMLVEAANLLRIQVNILDAPSSSAKQVVQSHDGHVDGSFKDPEAIKKLAAKSDVVTVEIEHVDTYMLEEISKTVEVQPSWKTLRTIQDKYLQKEHLIRNGIATAKSIKLDEASIAQLEQACETLGLPFMLKSRKEAYDGRGNFPVKTKDDFKPALEALGGNKDLYAEKWADFKMELAVMVVKTKDDVLSFPTVETIHENSICKLVYAPARGISKTVNEKAQKLARDAVACFEGKGVFGVEMFLLPDDTVLLNEIAPRPHNSGHYTIEACHVSQYEAHLSALLDLPLQQDDLQIQRPAVMLNILGGDTPDSHVQFAKLALKHRGAKVHLYGKGTARKGRKMGHATACARTISEAEAIIQPLLDFVDGRESKPVGRQPLVAVVMGSDSDLPVIEPGLAILDDFQIPYETRITSAHRTPIYMAEFASSAETKGLECIIAAAGGAAHLPGMVASHTSLPVIGIPVKPTIGDGMDSVLSILNMPNGVPVATVSVNKSVNAALLAARIIGRIDPAVNERYLEYMEKSAAESRRKDELLVQKGHKAYLTEMREKK